MYIPNVNSILAAGLALTGGSGLMKKRTFNFHSLCLCLSLPPLPFPSLTSSLSLFVTTESLGGIRYKWDDWGLRVRGTVVLDLGAVDYG